jgi:phosphohistidine phosphatase
VEAEINARADRTLVLIRHAKTEHGVPDRSRRLTDRGERDARTIGRWLAAAGVIPNLVVVSPAARARETWELAAVELAAAAGDGEGIATTVDERIYDNTVDRLLDLVESTDDNVATLALVGHNPSIGDLVAESHHGGGSGFDFPTATVAVLRWRGTWAAIRAAKVAVVAVQTCRDRIDT